MLAPSESWPSHLPPANPVENPFSRRINQPELVSIPFDTPVRWQLGVDLTYRGLICDLMEVNDFGATSDRASFLHTIRTLDPWGDGPGIWHATIVWGAPRLNKLIEAHFPLPEQRDDQLNHAFIEALEQIFAKNGLPWSDKPLLPIIPNAANSEAPPTR